MRYKSWFIAMALVCFASTLVYAHECQSGNKNNGENIFKKSGCHICHHASKDKMDAGLGPSLEQISGVYRANGGFEQLAYFFRKGKKRHVLISKKRFKVMKVHLKKIKKMSERDRCDLAAYVLSH